MDLSKAVAALALILGAALAADYARGSDNKPTVKDRTAAMEAQRRVAVEEQQRRKDDYVRRCAKPLMTRAELEACRAAYRRL